MITARNPHNGEPLELYGLSADTKPTDEVSGFPVVNGSTMWEIDTASIYVFDEESGTWMKQ